MFLKKMFVLLKRNLVMVNALTHSCVVSCKVVMRCKSSIFIYLIVSMSPYRVIGSVAMF